MRLVRSREHAARESGGRGNHHVVACDIELLDQERAYREECAVILMPERQAIGDLRLEPHARKMLLLDRFWQEVEQCEDVSAWEKLAQPRKNPLAAAKVRAPVVDDSDPHAGLQCATLMKTGCRQNSLLHCS